MEYIIKEEKFFKSHLHCDFLNTWYLRGWWVSHVQVFTIDFFYKWKTSSFRYIYIYMPCYTNINSLLLEIIDNVDFINNSRYINFWNFIYEVINLGDTSLRNTLLRVLLLIPISIIPKLMFSLIANEVFVIKFFGNFFPFTTNFFFWFLLWVFVICSIMFALWVMP